MSGIEKRAVNFTRTACFALALASGAASSAVAKPTAAAPTPPKTAEVYREEVRTVLKDIGRIVAPNGIDEGRYVELGGARQWIAIRGQDRAAPLLLFLHGGPGSTISDIAYSYQRPWEDFFTVVHWDQRGFGKSAGVGPAAAALKGTVNKEQVIADAIELIEMLRKEFGQRKIVLVGQSWGTVMTLEIAKRRPDLLHVAVVQGLAVNWLASPVMLWQHLIAEADKRGDTKEAARLRALGSPADAKDMIGWARAFGVGFPDPNTWHNIKGEGDGWGRRMQVLKDISPDLPAAEKATMDAAQAADPSGGFERYKEAMTPVLPWDADRDVGTRFKVPIVVMQGAHDWQTWTPLAKAYFGRICAPYKKFVEFPHAAHVLNLEQPGLSVVSLVNDVLPAVSGKVPIGAETCKEAAQ